VEKIATIDHEENPAQVKQAELVVGIPSHNGADYIGYATREAASGLVEHFSDKNSVIINCDSYSEDGTKEAFLQTPTEVPKIYLTTSQGMVGRGHSLRSLLTKVVELQARAVIVVDCNLQAITPLWIKNLGEPLFAGFGFVSPLYVRHKYDGVLANNIVYPLTRALYGRRVRQPLGGDFGFSGDLAETFLQHPTWNDAVGKAGIDVWMTTVAISRGLPICQSFLGKPRTQRHKEVQPPRPETFCQVVGTVFDLMIYFQDLWSRIKWSKPTAIFGFGIGEIEAPPPLEVSESGLYEAFVQGFASYRQRWEGILESNIFNKLNEIRELPLTHFSFPSQLWAQILFRYAIAYKSGAEDRQAMLASLQPIFVGKILSFIKKTERMSIQQAEEYIENECMIFEEMKPYLLSEWDESK